MRMGALRAVIFLLILVAVGVGLNALRELEPDEQFLRDHNVHALKQSIAELEHRVQESPWDLSAHLLLAHAFEVLGNNNRSVVHYAKAWDQVKQSPDELTRFALVLSKTGRGWNDKVRELLERALALDPLFVDALILQGTALLATDQQGTRELWQKALALLHKSDERYDALEQMIFMLEQKGKANGV